MVGCPIISNIYIENLNNLLFMILKHKVELTYDTIKIKLAAVVITPSTNLTEPIKPF